MNQKQLMNALIAQEQGFTIVPQEWMEDPANENESAPGWPAMFWEEQDLREWGTGNIFNPVEFAHQLWPLLEELLNADDIVFNHHSIWWQPVPNSRIPLASIESNGVCHQNWKWCVCVAWTCWKGHGLNTQEILDMPAQEASEG